MRILNILASYGEGGLEKHTVDLVNNLAERGVTAGIAADKSLKRKFTSDVHFYNWNVDRSRLNPGLHLSLLKIIKEFNPCVCHAQANKAGVILSNVQRFINPIKCIVTIHNIKNNLGFAGKLDAAIGVSDAVAAQIANDHVYRIYNGITPVCLEGNESIRSSDTLICVGRLVDAKGFDVLIKAISKSKYKLNIVGDGPLRPDLESLVVNLHLKDRVKFLGHRDDIPLLLHNALALVISSRREGFSYVFAEALLTKTAVISTSVPVANEVLAPHFLCNSDSVVDLEHLLSKLNINDPAYNDAFHFGAEHFTIDAMVSKTCDVYRSLLKFPVNYLED